MRLIYKKTYTFCITCRCRYIHVASRRTNNFPVFCSIIVMFLGKHKKYSKSLIPIYFTNQEKVFLYVYTHLEQFYRDQITNCLPCFRCFLLLIDLYYQLNEMKSSDFLQCLHYPASHQPIV